MNAVVIIPTYNERDNVPQLVDALLRLDGVRVLVVDDQSPDGTGAVADEAARKHPGRVDVLHRTTRRGFGRSYIDGIKRAIAGGADLICQMDADFSHDPARLPALLGTEADLVLGSRYVPGGSTVNWGLGRRILSRGGSLYARTILGLPIRDLTGGFKCFRRRVLEGLDLASVRSSGYAFQIELTYRAIKRGFKVLEVPITFADRRVGKSKMSRGIVAEALWMVWKIRFDPAANAR
jgi:dolichol-phosphate mannosyltransferase